MTLLLLLSLLLVATTCQLVPGRDILHAYLQVCSPDSTKEPKEILSAQTTDINTYTAVPHYRLAATALLTRMYML